MTSMKKLLLTGACAGLLALGAAPAAAAGPMMSTAKGDALQSDAVHNAEFRRHQWQGYRSWHQPPRRHYYGHNRPPYGHAYGYRYGRHHWSGRNHWYGRGDWRNHRGYFSRRHNDRGYWNQRIH
ncbi:MAG: hypothetical protein AB7O88_10060 [Reyranellaceae bacterium]